MKKFLALMILFVSTLYCTAQYTIGYYKYGVLTECSFDKATFLHHGDTLFYCYTVVGETTLYSCYPDHPEMQCQWTTDYSVAWITSSFYTPTSDSIIIIPLEGEWQSIRPVLYTFNLSDFIFTEEVVDLNDSLIIEYDKVLCEDCGDDIFYKLIIPDTLVYPEEEVYLTYEKEDPNWPGEYQLPQESSIIEPGKYRITLFQMSQMSEIEILFQKTITVTQDVSDLNSSEVKSFSFYPNPATEILNLSDESDFKILDITGKTVLSGYSNSVNISNLPDGMYFFVSEKNKIKFIKQ